MNLINVAEGFGAREEAHPENGTTMVSASATALGAKSSRKFQRGCFVLVVLLRVNLEPEAPLAAVPDHRILFDRWGLAPCFLSTDPRRHYVGWDWTLSRAGLIQGFFTFATSRYPNHIKLPHLGGESKLWSITWISRSSCRFSSAAAPCPPLSPC